MHAGDSKIEGVGCQSVRLQRTSEPLSRVEVAWQFRFKLKRVLKRRLNYLSNRISRPGRTAYVTATSEGAVASRALEVGELVRVRSREEIQATLDPWGYLKGCGFMEEMWPYCGTRQRVLKPVRRFLDERDYRVRKARGIVLLEGLTCSGTRDYGECDRNCYYFWREEWLVRDELPDLGSPSTPGV